MRVLGPRTLRGEFLIVIGGPLLLAKDLHKILRDLGCRLPASSESFFLGGSPLEPGGEDRARGGALHALGHP